MKKFPTLLLCIFFSATAFCATFTFSGNGQWTDPDLWDTYPGETIMPGDEVIIDGNCELINEIIYFNHGILTINPTGSLIPWVGMPDSYWYFINSGSFTNNGTMDQGNVDNTGGFTQNGLTLDVYFVNMDDGEMNNYGTMDNGSFVDNASTFINHADSDMIDIGISNGGLFYNYGNLTGGPVYPGSLENYGFFENHGTIDDVEVDVYSGGNLQNFVGASITCDYFDSSSTVSNEGSITVNEYCTAGGTFDNASGGVLAINGTLEITGMFSSAGDINNSGTMLVLPDFEPVVDISGGLDNFGDLIVNQDMMVSGDFTNHGTLMGEGSIQGDVMNNGSVEPGNSPGILTINGNFTQGPGGTLVFEIEGPPNPGIDHDQLIVNGLVNLEGTIQITSSLPVVDGPACYDLIVSSMDFGLFAPTEDINVNILLIYTAYTEQIANSYKFVIENAVLPVEIGSLKANLRDDVTELSWNTFSEVNNDGFEIQKSANAKDWDKIGFVKGYGNSLVEQQYQFIDKKPFPGNSYYRLKQLDTDGQFTYSEIVEVNFKGALGRVYASNSLLIFEGIILGQNIQIYDLSGRLIYNERLKDNTLDVSHLMEGMYILKMKNHTLKFVK